MSVLKKLFKDWQWPESESDRICKAEADAFFAKTPLQRIEDMSCFCSSHSKQAYIEKTKKRWQAEGRLPDGRLPDQVS